MPRASFTPARRFSRFGEHWKKEGPDQRALFFSARSFETLPAHGPRGIYWEQGGRQPSAGSRSTIERTDTARSGGSGVHRTIPVLCAFLVLTAALVALQNGCAPGRHRDGARRADPSFALARGDTAEALRLLEEKAGNRPAPPETFLLLGRLYRSRGSITDRLRAQTILEDGLRRYPDHPDLLAELGATLYAQTLYGDAERVFGRLLEIDPHRCEAHYYLGINAYRKWKRVQSYTEYLCAAERFLRVAVECDPAKEDAHFKLAFSRCVLGDTARALETCAGYRAAYPTAPEPLFLSGSIAYASGELETCRERFDEAFSLLAEDERTAYTDSRFFSARTTRPTRMSRLPSPTGKRSSVCSGSPTIPIRRPRSTKGSLEHVYRVFMSDVRLRVVRRRRSRGWETARGKALIKFGEADHVETTLEGLRPMDGRTEIWTLPRHRAAVRSLLPGRVPQRKLRHPHRGRDLGVDAPRGSAAHRPRSRRRGCSRHLEAHRVPRFGRRRPTSTLVYAADADSLDSRLWTWNIEAVPREDRGLSWRTGVPTDSSPTSCRRIR